jgi:GT2 family glycosyltransferase
MDAARQPILSVIVKCHNEEAKLGLCLDSLLAETAGLDAEIIVVDSLSEDGSLAVAAGYPVQVVQLDTLEDRRCGAAAHLGWQFARGRFLLLMDGDMELLPGFLGAALGRIQKDPLCAAVGGHLVEMSEGIEFRERQLRANPDRAAGAVSHITGCALYRQAAIQHVGHFMDHGLHCYEEFELGARLRAKGWRLLRLDMPCVRHHGHRDAPLALLRRRWQTKFLHGHGELLRAAWGKPYFAEAVKHCRMALIVISWWTTLVALALATLFVPWMGAVLLAALALPPLALLARKRSIRRAAYTLALWQLCASSLLAGLLAKRVRPTTPFGGHIVQERGRPPPMPREPRRTVFLMPGDRAEMRDVPPVKNGANG